MTTGIDTDGDAVDLGSGPSGEGDYEPNKTLADLETMAAARNCYVLQPAPDELFVDVDSVDAALRLEHALSRLDQTGWTFIVAIGRASSSQRGRRKHVVVKVKKQDHSALTPWERIALQAVLGSDLERELSSCVDLIEGHEVATCFFEPKTIAKMVDP